MHKKLFPDLASARWGVVNLDELARRDFPNTSDPKSPLLDPQRCSEWIDQLHKSLDMDFSYGGFRENRSHLWRGSYLQHFYHLGVDFNVPFDTKVHAVMDGKVIYVFEDMDTDGGWGGRVIIDHDRKEFPCLIYAHLRPASVRVRRGDRVRAGQVIGSIGNPMQNGGWFPHLHVQAFQSFIPEDGYGDEKTAYWEWRYPDPLALFGEEPDCELLKRLV